MLKRGRGRPRKQACTVATLRSPQKVHFEREGEVLNRTQLSLRGFKNLARRNRSHDSKNRHIDLQDHETRTLCSHGCLCQQTARRVPTGHDSTFQCGYEHADWNSGRSGEAVRQNADWEPPLKIRQDEPHNNEHIDQWVDVRVSEFQNPVGSLAGEVALTTSTVHDELRIILAGTKARQLHALHVMKQQWAPLFVPKRRRTDRIKKDTVGQDRAWITAKKDYTVPSWLSCRRKITRRHRKPDPRGLPDHHITTLLASLPRPRSRMSASLNDKTSTQCQTLTLHADDTPTLSKSVASRNEESPLPGADTKGATSCASQQSVVDSGQNLSNFSQEKHGSACLLQRVIFQDCPATPDKTQKRRRDYGENFQSHDFGDIDASDMFNDARQLSGYLQSLLDFHLSSAGYNVKALGPGQFPLVYDSNPFTANLESSCDPTRQQRLEFPVDSLDLATDREANTTSIPAIAEPFRDVTSATPGITYAIKERPQQFQTIEPSRVIVEAANIRREERAKVKVAVNHLGTKSVPTVKRKYKPRVAKDKRTYKRHASRTQKETDGGDYDIEDRELAITPTNPIQNDKTSAPAHFPHVRESATEGNSSSGHRQGPFDLRHDRASCDYASCDSCRCKRRTTSGELKVEKLKHINSDIYNTSEDQIIMKILSGTFQNSQVPSAALPNSKLAVQDWPSNEKPHLNHSTAREVEQTLQLRCSNDAQCFGDSTLTKNSRSEDDLSSFSHYWTASHAVSAEMFALDALNEELTRIDSSFLQELSARPGIHCNQIQDANGHQCNADTLVGRGRHISQERPSVQDPYNLLSRTYGGSGEQSFESGNRSTSFPFPVRRSLMAQFPTQETAVESPLSSFYASLRDGVNQVTLSSLEDFVHDQTKAQNAQKQILQSNERSSCNLSEAPRTCYPQRPTETEKGPEELHNRLHGEIDVMSVGNMVMPRLDSQFLQQDSDSNFVDRGALVPQEAVKSLVGCHDQLLNKQNAILNGLCLREICPKKTPFQVISKVQSVVYFKIILMFHPLGMSPLKLLRHVQKQLPEAQRREFELLWPAILIPMSREQLQKFANYAKIDLTASIEFIQNQQGNGRYFGAEEGINLTSLVPYQEGKEVVTYTGPFHPLRQRKPRPKVVLDMETLRMWKLLMGKADATENEPDIDKQLKWKEERRIMKEQAEIFIRRMHLVQGDRSFSRWKGSVVDSVVGTFLTQNVSDVLSSSAFMCLRARFPGRRFRGPFQCKNPEEDTDDSNRTEYSIPLPMQTLQEPQLSCPRDVAPRFGSTFLLSECEQTFLKSHESRSNKIHSGDLVTQQEETILSLWSGSQESSILDVQHETCPVQNQPDQASATDAFVEISAFNANSIINENCNLSEKISLVQTQVETIFSQEEETGESRLTTKNDMSNDVMTEQNPLMNIDIPNQGLTGPERARLEAQQVWGSKASNWSALKGKWQTRHLDKEMDSAPARTELTEDGIDWEAVCCADVEEVASVIKERGMNWKLAGRIKGFLERLRLEHGAIDLEWLRSISSEDAKEFLLSIHGLGLKSVECIRLLALHHLAFPVDTNVGRICVRLGWVPLEPLPEELQLHLLELYPVQATIQKYLWPRLCTLDQHTLYELHYQMITFGKVFCTKTKPNCNACPMKSDCKHFASSVASARLALPASHRSPDYCPTLELPPSTSSAAEVGKGPPQLTEASQPSMGVSQNYEPIVEEPESSESEANMSDCDIEDYPFPVELAEESILDLFVQEIQENHPEVQQLDNPKCYNTAALSRISSESDPVYEGSIISFGALVLPPQSASEIDPTITSLESAIKVSDIEAGPQGDVSRTANILVPDATSQELVMLPPEAASISVPKLKSVGRLRTVHYVYELPDDHPLLEEMDVREADDPCYYLLAIWSPGEVPETIPNINDNNEESPFVSSSFDSNEENIKATLLVPCRTAMQGSFPLNGTYFQVNEVFADHASSLQPLSVPRRLLWNLRRRFVYFGTSITSILRGMTAEEVQACFWRGYVCVRGFDRTTRAPKPLVGRLHGQTAKSPGKGESMKVTKRQRKVKH